MDWWWATMVRALYDAGVDEGAVVFSHASLAGFGKEVKLAPAQAAMAAFTTSLGLGGTLCVPAFTYSACRGEPFNPDDPLPPDMGAFAQHVWEQPNARRSRDPIFSVVAIGAKAADLTMEVGMECFGPDSFWSRFLANDGWIVNLNCDAWSTFIHYVERCLDVPYRKDRRFTSLDADGLPTGEVVYFSRDLDDPKAEADFETWDRVARETGVARTARVGRGEIVAMRAADVYALIEERVTADPWFLVKGDGR